METQYTETYTCPLFFNKTWQGTTLYQKITHNFMLVYDECLVSVEIRNVEDNLKLAGVQRSRVLFRTLRYIVNIK